MKRNVPAESVFYLHTDPDQRGRATIALQRLGDSIFWGLSICSGLDNFKKDIGREIAALRMKEGFARIPISKPLTGFEKESQLLSFIANGIAHKVSSNFNKWRHRINNFEDNLEATKEPLD